MKSIFSDYIYDQTVKALTSVENATEEGLPDEGAREELNYHVESLNDLRKVTLAQIEALTILQTKGNELVGDIIREQTELVSDIDEFLKQFADAMDENIDSGEMTHRESVRIDYLNAIGG